MKKFLFLLLFLGLMNFLHGCVRPCGRGPNVVYPKHFTYDSVQVQPHKVVLQADSMIGYFEGQDLESGTVGLLLDFKLYPLAKTKPSSARGFQWINAAYACSPVEPIMHADEFFTGISIKTQYALDASYPEGSEVSHLFVVLEQGYNPNHIIRKPLSAWRVEQVPVGSLVTSQVFYLNHPINTGPTAFSVDFTLSSGRHLQAFSDTFQIQ